jgi:hypothetical protein
VIARIVMIAVVGVGLASPSRAGYAREARGAVSPSSRWSPDRVRDLVLRVQREMDLLEAQEYRTAEKGRHPAAMCHGQQAAIFIDKAQVIRRVRPLLAEPALSCYVTTILGCDLGSVIGVDVPVDGRSPSEYKPFTLSNVTIIEQTTDRVVADVQELGFEEVDNGVAGTWTDEEPRRFTAKELAKSGRTSRYTISKGADGVWRISDRKPPFQWECKSRY